MTLCYITDRRALEPGGVLPAIASAIEAGVDMIQIREKDLPVGELLKLTSASLEAARGTGTRVLINDRLDVALAANAGGVHLGNESMPAARIRAALGSVIGECFWVGVSCHSVADVRAAEASGASYAVLGPIFETPSKRIYGPPIGLDVLAEAARSCQIPLLALGGITPERALTCIEAGATGIAGISMFQGQEIPVAALRDLRRQLHEAVRGRTPR